MAEARCGLCQISGGGNALSEFRLMPVLTKRENREIQFFFLFSVFSFAFRLAILLRNGYNNKETAK